MKIRILVLVMLNILGAALLMNARNATQGEVHESAQGAYPVSVEPFLGLRSEKPIPATEKVILQEALRRVPDLVLPRYVPDSGTLQETWVSYKGVPPAQRSVALIYSNEIKVLIEPIDADWDPLYFSRPPEDPFVSVIVNGLPGIGKEPGPKVLSSGSVWEGKGTVVWQVGRFLVQLYGPYSLEEMLRVAESMLFHPL